MCFGVSNHKLYFFPLFYSSFFTVFLVLCFPTFLVGNIICTTFVAEVKIIFRNRKHCLEVQNYGVVSSIKVIAFYNLDLREVPQGKYWWKLWGLTLVWALGQCFKSHSEVFKICASSTEPQLISMLAAGCCGQSGWSSIGHIQSKQAKERELAKEPWETLMGPLTLDERKPHAITPPTKNTFIVCLSEGE